MTILSKLSHRPYGLKRTNICLFFALVLGLACEAGISRAQETRPRQLFERLPQHQESGYHHPHVAPSGRKIAFSASNPRRRNNTIWIYDLASEQIRELTKFDSTTTLGDMFVRWSPDAEHLAFASDRMWENHIWLVQADGGPARRLTEMETRTQNRASARTQNRATLS